MEYYQITVHTVSEAVEAISYAFTELGAGGVEIFDPKDVWEQEKSPLNWDFIDENLLQELKRNDVLMRCYFSTEVVPNPKALEDLLMKIRTALEDMRQYLPIGSGQVETKLMAEEEWADAWKKYYKPFHLGHHIFVVPSWIEAEAEPDDICITLDPGMAFGTGTHETTSMCMELLEEQVQAGDTVLDIGCGSGILGIVAAKVGAGQVVCSDLDPNAVLVAKENVQKNQVADRTQVYAGNLTEVPALQNMKADLIVANIIADVIIILAPQASEFLKQGGTFIASGIIKERRADVEAALKQAGYQIEEVKEQGSWVAIRSRLQ